MPAHGGRPGARRRVRGRRVPAGRAAATTASTPSTTRSGRTPVRIAPFAMASRPVTQRRVPRVRGGGRLRARRVLDARRDGVGARPRAPRRRATGSATAATGRCAGSTLARAIARGRSRRAGLPPRGRGLVPLGRPQASHGVRMGVRGAKRRPRGPLSVGRCAAVAGARARLPARAAGVRRPTRHPRRAGSK